MVDDDALLKCTLIGWLFKRRSTNAQGIATRMTEDEVIAVARTAVPESEMVARTLANPRCADHQGKLIWTVSSATKGAGVVVEVDDATGAVVGRRYRSGR